MEREPLEFLEQLLDSIVKLDLLVFFHENPDTMDDAAGLSIWIGREVARVRQAAEELAAAQILEKWGGDSPVYRLTSDPKVRWLLDEFVRSKVRRKEARIQLLRSIQQREAKLS